MTDARVAVILPALDEEGAVASVVQGFRATGARVVVVDNGSTDATSSRAQDAGAELVSEPRRGYGSACLAGIAHLAPEPPDLVVFADCDGTLDPAELHLLAGPVLAGEADLVLGRRVRVARGALPHHQRLGNAAVLFALRLLFRTRLVDMPPYRAISWSLLSRLHLRETTYGLPLETLGKSLRLRARVREVDTSYRVRVAGDSKVAGSPIASVRAGAQMLALCFRLRFGRWN